MSDVIQNIKHLEKGFFLLVENLPPFANRITYLPACGIGYSQVVNRNKHPSWTVSFQVVWLFTSHQHIEVSLLGFVLTKYT